MPTATKLLSYEEWLTLPEDGEVREECVNGIVEKMPPSKSGHAFIVENLADILRIGIPEVWVVNPADRTMTTNGLENGAYQPTLLTERAVTAPARFPSLTVDLTHIWR